MDSNTIEIANNSHPNKRSLYTEFILWTAMPHAEKVRLAIESQKDFAEQNNVHESTLWRWKHRSDFEKRVDAILKMWSTDKTPAVIHSIYKSAIKGNPLSQQLWLGYFKGYNPRKIEEPKEKVEISENDFRYIVSILPEPYKTKFNGYITEIITTANSLRNARSGEDDGWNSPRPEDTILIEPDTDAQDIPSAGTNVVAQSYTRSASCNMGANANRATCASPSDNQSTARGW